MKGPNGLPPANPEFLPETPFDMAFASTLMRFAEALDIPQSRYQHVGLDTSPFVPEYLAVFKMADDYDAAVEGHGESFELGLPIHDLDKAFVLEKIRPRLAELEQPYFMVRLTRAGQTYFISQSNYAEYFESATPVIADFQAKLDRFGIIPLRRSSE